MVEGLREAGQKLDELTNDLDPRERADGYRALLRAVNNLTGRLEGDPDTPGLMPFNGWRDKFFMDNPRLSLLDHRHPGRPQVPGHRQRGGGFDIPVDHDLCRDQRRERHCGHTHRHRHSGDRR